MKLSSSVFEEGGIIPSRYTCEGANVNPPLHFHDVPKEAQSLVLIMDDPDVPLHIRQDHTWDHWIVYNLPANTTGIQEAADPPGICGKTTYGSCKYGGPCPPDREHRYFFKLYALDIQLKLPDGAEKKEVEKAMEGHILDSAELMGRYEKGKGY